MIEVQPVAEKRLSPNHRNHARTLKHFPKKVLDKLILCIIQCVSHTI